MPHEVLKFLFDENISPKCFKLIDEALKRSNHEIEAVSVPQQFGYGKWDDAWIPKAAKERCLIISFDHGRCGKKKGIPLPTICQHYGMNLVLLSSSIQQTPGNEERVRAIVETLDGLIKAWEAPAGTRFCLRYGSLIAKSGMRRFVLEEKK